MTPLPSKHSVTLAGHTTSVSLEPEFWAALKQIAKHRATSLNRLIGEIDARRGDRGLSSSLRVFVLAHHRSQGDA
ncbi:MAG: ribbon-helix-helix domain-containing protein [Alphaproteobacteria bacterium]